MKYAFIEGLRREYRLPVLCRVLGVSRSGFYKWRSRSCSPRQQRREETLLAIRRVFEESDRSYGSPRIERELRSQGRAHSRRFIGKLMKANGLRARGAARRRPLRSEPLRHAGGGNLLARRFSISEPNTVWASDLTYIATREGWLYLAVVMDLSSRRVIGWSMRGSPDGELTLSALEMALQMRRPTGPLLHHSDRGLQYASHAYLARLEEHGITVSLSRVGNCWDNAVVESFFKTLKVERTASRPLYCTRREARQDIFNYIEVWYNRRRRHSTLGYISPAEYEARLQIAVY
jgi:putative transposase